MSDFARRLIIQPDEFLEQLYALQPNFEEADAFTEAAIDLLSYQPDIGMEGRDGVWLLPMFPLRGRQVTLYYSFNTQVVTLLAILAD